MSSTSSRKRASSSSSSKSSGRQASASRKGSGSSTRSGGTSRRGKKAGANPAVVWGVTGIGVAILIIIGALVIPKLIGGGEGRVIDPNQDLSSMIPATKSQVVQALRGNSKENGQAALNQLNKVKVKVQSWMKEMEGQGWSEEDMGRQLKIWGWPDLYAMDRNLREFVLTR